MIWEVLFFIVWLCSLAILVLAPVLIVIGFIQLVDWLNATEQGTPESTDQGS